MSLSIRAANENDVPQIRAFIVALADYEHLSHEAVVQEQDLQHALFVEKSAEVVIADWGEEPAGFALFFHNFSTFLGKKGLYLEDLFVYPNFRGKGIGKALLDYLAALAKQRNCGRFEWVCLDWNEPSLAFYQSLGAEKQPQWIIHRVCDETLDAMARSGDKC